MQWPDQHLWVHHVWLCVPLLSMCKNLAAPPPCCAGHPCGHACPQCGACAWQGWPDLQVSGLHGHHCQQADRARHCAPALRYTQLDGWRAVAGVGGRDWDGGERARAARSAGQRAAWPPLSTSRQSTPSCVCRQVCLTVIGWEDGWGAQTLHLGGV
jgi:hypothetical protein